ncbi:MAG: NFACT family protein [Synergistaceae bacterium]|jgi:predicted ribosome quality control (RQC) complex YloA/Tae2 family protein|nr:NFACT family protein [Synergistaceae bacterium]
MALGPELVFMQARDISREFAKNKVRRVDARDDWLCLSFSRDRALCFSWNAENYGACGISPQEIRSLSDASPARPTICDAVKSHVVGAELAGASSLNRDRVLSIEFRRAIGAGFHQTRRLLFEPSGRYSNLMLLDEEGVVIEAAKHIYPDSNRYRSVMPGLRYSPPPVVKGVPLDSFDPSSEGALRELDSLRGVGKPLISAVKAHCGTRDARDSDEALRGLEFLKTGEGEAIFQVIGGYVTLYPILLDSAKAIMARDSLEAARIAVVAPMVEGRLMAARRKIAARIGEMSRANDRKIEAYERLGDGEGEIARLKLHGSLILANAWAIEPRSKEATLSEWTESGEVRHRIALDPERDAPRNAEALFAKYKRKKSALERARAILPSLCLRRDELDEQLALLECHTDMATLSKMWEEIAPEGARTPRFKSSGAVSPPHARYEFPFAGAVVFCGLSAKGNHYVTFRLAQGDDMWLHVKDMPGAHVILRFNERMAPGDERRPRMLNIAAACAVYHSGGRAGGRALVDCAERKHVRPISGGGLARVTYREFRTISADASAWIDEVRRIQ